MSLWETAHILTSTGFLTQGITTQKNTGESISSILKLALLKKNDSRELGCTGSCL